WARDGLSLEECLSMAYAWNDRNDPPDDKGKIESTVKWIFEKHQREHTGAVIQSKKCSPMTLIKLADLLKEPDEDVSWTVDNTLPTGGFSVLASKPKTGKSTL